VRVAAVEAGKLEEGIRPSQELHGRLRYKPVEFGAADQRSITVGLFVQSPNHVIDLPAERATIGLRNRIPGTVWIALYCVTILEMGRWATGRASAERAARWPSRPLLHHQGCGECRGNHIRGRPQIILG